MGFSSCPQVDMHSQNTDSFFPTFLLKHTPSGVQLQATSSIDSVWNSNATLYTNRQDNTTEELRVV